MQPLLILRSKLAFNNIDYINKFLSPENVNNNTTYIFLPPTTSIFVYIDSHNICFVGQIFQTLLQRP